MRTTIRLDENLLTRAKHHALRTGRTLTAVIEDALRAHLASRKQRASREPVHLTTVGGRGLQPGVDLDNTASLLDLMDREDAPR